MTKTNKRALISSVIALVLCFTMLLGTTFAWFTDSATSSGNKIQSGTLKVDLEVLEEDNQTWTSIKDSKDPIFTYDKWEPGFTQVKILRVVNEGTLALKWKAQLVSSAPLGELAKVIDVYVKEDVATYPTDRNDLSGWTKLPGTLADFVANIETTTTGEIKAAVGNETACEVLGIAFKMQESAGNDYQDKTLGAFDINILATQNTVEDDSFNNQYDAQAQYPVLASTPAALNDALENAQPGQTIELAENVDYGAITVDGTLSDVTIDGAEGTELELNIEATASLSNVTLKNVEVYNEATSGSYLDGGVVNIREGAQVDNLVFDSCDFSGTGGRSSGISIAEPSAEITLKNSTFSGTKYAVYGSEPVTKLTVEGCTFENISSWAILLNAGASVDAQLTMNNNTFTNCVGGIAKYLGNSVPEDGFVVFTNNTLTGCTGHDGHENEWFKLPYASAAVTVSGNTLDGAAWTPGTAQGLGK